MDMNDKGKKIKSFAPILSVALVTACVVGSLSGYKEPVYAAQKMERLEDKVSKTTSLEKVEKKSTAKGSFDLADGVYKGTGTGLPEILLCLFRLRISRLWRLIS